MREGWRKTSLGEVAEVVGGGTPKTAVPEYWGEEVVWLTPTEVVAAEGGVIHHSQRRLTRLGLERSGAKLLPRDAVLLTSRATVGATALAGCEVATNQGFQSLVASDHVLPRFLLYWVQANRHEFERRASGSTFPEISRSEVGRVSILLPPLAEQARIVDLITAVDEAIEAADTAVTTTFRAANGLREEIFTRLAAGPVDRADAVFDMLLGRQKSERQSVGEYVIPYLRAANITDDGLKLDDVQRMNFEPAEQVRYCLRDNDVLLVEGGTIGNVARWSGELPGRVGFDKHLIRLREREGKSSGEYAVQWAKWSRQTGAFANQATGITIKALGFGRASAMPVPAINIHKQAAIVAPLKAADDLRAELGRHLSSLTAVRSALLDELLSGEHAIPASYDELLSA